MDQSNPPVTPPQPHSHPLSPDILFFFQRVYLVNMLGIIISLIAGFFDLHCEIPQPIFFLYIVGMPMIFINDSDGI
uniref:Uncharacterized protein n=1 Tax=Nelumbo nucifera TaxID=4432 RepID=A0A822YX85_NELNU|nr:TPA_asm: hypothetical protein HUJ06_006415 [Nelumbo nucifera]